MSYKWSKYEGKKTRKNYRWNISVKENEYKITICTEKDTLEEHFIVIGEALDNAVNIALDITKNMLAGHENTAFTEQSTKEMGG